MIKSAVDLKSMRSRLEDNLKVDKLKPKIVEDIKDRSAFGKLEKKKNRIESKAFS